MASFGEDLRKERLSRGLKLENINAITKISLSHLLALEQNRFRLLPGGILNKGIVRGYAAALGLDPHAWTERFLAAYSASDPVTAEEPNWTAFASNVGRARILRHDAAEERLRWLGASVLLLVVVAAAFLTLRYLGLRAGWWPSLLPFHAAHHVPVRAAVSSMRPLITRVSSWFRH
jgi:cytoskeleton protein RodZ